MNVSPFERLSAVRLMGAFIVCLGVSATAAELVRSQHYIPVKEPEIAHAENHYLVATFLLSQGALANEQKAALETGQRRAEQLILKKWADTNLKPFRFVNYSTQRRDLYVLERVIKSDAPPGQRVSDAVKTLANPPSLRADVNVCYGFRWVKGLKSATFTAWINNPANQRSPQLVQDRIASARRVLQGKMDGEYRAMLRRVLSFEGDIEGGADAATKASAAYRKYLFIQDAISQFSGDHQRRLENMLPLASSQTVELGLARFESAEFSSPAELERLIALFQGTVSIWRGDANLKSLAEQRAKEIEEISGKLESGRGTLWADEFATMTEALHFVGIYRLLRSRMIEIGGMPESARKPLLESLWDSYDIVLPEAAYYWETMCDIEIKNGSRAGLAYLIVEQLSALAMIHESYKEPLGPGAEDTREALTDLRKKYTNYCVARNTCRVVINPKDTGAIALEAELKKALAAAPWLALVEIVREPAGAPSRQWRVFQDGSRLAVSNGSAGPKQLSSNPATAAGQIVAMVGAYPLALAKQAEEASDITVSLNFYGYLHVILASIDTKAAKDPKNEGFIKELEVLKTTAREASSAQFSEWVEDRRQADLVTRAEEENTADPDEALFD